MMGQVLLRQKKWNFLASLGFVLLPLYSFSAVPQNSNSVSSQKAESVLSEEEKRSLKDRLRNISLKNSQAQSQALIFDLPVTYNRQVSKWVNYFQTTAQRSFREWLERSSRYLPFIQQELRDENMPTDLAFMVMIESGFSSSAVSAAQAVGPWQFIATTGNRYGLTKNWWLDERKDVEKSTKAAIRYMKDLYQEFGSWYLVAASYNMGENGLRRQIQKHGTRDFWTLIKKKALPDETQEYVPKILAAMLISKAPNLYGFRSLERREILAYDTVKVPGGTDLDQLADKIGVTRKSLKDLNSEILLGYIPRQVSQHAIRVPKGAKYLVTDYISEQNRRLSRE